MPEPGYQEDLAYIHDAGFSGHCQGAAPGILAMLRRHGFTRGLIADLGCGSGRFAALLLRAGYGVWGVDLSEAMIAMARGNAPEAEFEIASLLDAGIPRCRAAVSLGEGINYLGAGPRGALAVPRFFERVHAALEPGGVFTLDFSTPDRVPASGRGRLWREEEGWAVLAEISGNAEKRTMRRRVVCYREVDGAFRRSEEVHRLRLYPAEEVAEQLRAVGFQPRILRRYGCFPLLPGVAAIAAVKPLR